MSAYDLGAETLKQLLAANPQLNPDAIAMTMDKVAETLADQAEVEDAITVGNQIIANNSGASNMDEDELMKELEQIIEEKKKEEEDMAKLEKLDNVIPNAPTYLPNPPTTTSNTTTTIIETTEDYTQLSDDQIGSVLDGLLEKEMKSLKLEDEKMEEKGSKNQQDLKKKKEGKVAILAEY